MKRFFYKVLLEFLKLLVQVKRFFVALWKYVSPRLARVASIAVRFAFFGVFKYYVGVRRRIESQFNNSTEEKIYAFTGQRIFVSLLIAVLVVTVVLPHTKFWERPVYSAVGSDSMLLAIIGPNSSDGEYTADDQVVDVQEGFVTNDQNGDMVTYDVQSGPTGDNDAGIEELSGLTEGGAGVEAPLLMPNAEVTPSRREITAYVVQSGDTLSTIAAKFGIDQKTIMGENNRTEKAYIRPGDVLSILPVSGVSHVVKRGDTLSSIAKLYGMNDVDKLIEFNRLANASDIVIGEKLVIPGGVRKVAPPKPMVNSKTPTNLSYKNPPKDFFSPPANPSSSGLVTKSPIYAPASYLNIAPPPPSKYAGNSGMVWPTSGHVVTQYYSATHHALDIDGHYDTPIYAADSGVVKIAGWRTNGYGLSVDIDHENGIVTRYGHASRLYISVGDRVVKGQVIGMVGTTGHSTGTHLHFEIMVRGVKVNPFQYVR